MDKAARSLVDRLTQLRNDCSAKERAVLDEIVLHGVAIHTTAMRTQPRLPAKRLPASRSARAASSSSEPEVVGFAAKEAKFGLEKEKIEALKVDASSRFGLSTGFNRSDLIGRFEAAGWWSA